MWAELVRQADLADCFDVLFVALFTFGALQWLRRSAPKSVIAALSISLVLLFLARLADLRMTNVLLESLFVLVSISAVVVFQADIRRLFDRVAAWRWFAPTRLPAHSPSVADVCAPTAMHLGSLRTGALIALKGREDWSLHIEGGTPLDGQISESLLRSLFDPHVPAHDGAVLVDGDRVVRFGAHLPLSRNQGQVGTGGTRHAAALGLSEHCDSIVIVVSEETGNVSIAEEGQLDAIDSIAALEHRLVRHIERISSRGAEHDQIGVSRSVGTALLSLLVAVGLWFLVVFEAETATRPFGVPLEFRNLDRLLAVADTQHTVTVSLRGAVGDFDAVDASQLVLSIDLDEFDEGEHTLALTETAVKNRGPLEVDRIEPSSLSIEILRLQVVEVPVEVVTRQASQADEVEAVPPRVKLLWPAETESPPFVETQEVDVATIDEGTPVTAMLVLPDGARLPRGQPDSVRVQLRQKPQ